LFKYTQKRTNLLALKKLLIRNDTLAMDIICFETRNQAILKTSKKQY